MRDIATVNAWSGWMPSWVPQSARHYLAHTEAGLPIRELARDAGCHASTVLRQIRNYESRREDPLVDAALSRLSRALPYEGAGSFAKEKRMKVRQTTESHQDQNLTEATLHQEAARVLRRLCESGSLLVVAANMDKAVIVRTRDGEEPLRTGIVDKEVAEAMALKGWLRCGQAGRIARYAITATGRETLSRLLAEAENKALGFADAQAVFNRPEGEATEDKKDSETDRSRRKRYSMAESPLLVLARRKDREGAPFLSDDLVRAGERLREDFELAQMEPRGNQSWDSYLTEEGGDIPLPSSNTPRGRVAGALRDLGPGLGDVVLRCCCNLEGLEQAEKRMGWSARSAKVVLRIALQRLHRHYRQLGDAGQMIG